VGARAARRTTRSASQPPLLNAFARLLHDRDGARLYLFGSRSRGDARPDGDDDLVAVSDAFADHPRFRRAPGRRDLRRAAGGWGTALDRHCRTKAEFREEDVERLRRERQRPPPRRAAPGRR